MKRIIAGEYRSGIADDPPRYNRIGLSIVTAATREHERARCAVQARAVRSWREVVRFGVNCLSESNHASWRAIY